MEKGNVYFGKKSRNPNRKSQSPNAEGRKIGSSCYDEATGGGLCLAGSLQYEPRRVGCFQHDPFWNTYKLESPGDC